MNANGGWQGSARGVRRRAQATLGRTGGSRKYSWNRQARRRTGKEKANSQSSPHRRVQRGSNAAKRWCQPSDVNEEQATDHARKDGCSGAVKQGRDGANYPITTKIRAHTKSANQAWKKPSLKGTRWTGIHNEWVIRLTGSHWARTGVSSAGADRSQQRFMGTASAGWHFGSRPARHREKRLIAAQFDAIADARSFPYSRVLQVTPLRFASSAPL